MKFCYNCGTQLEDAARFCINCGSSQEITQTQSVETEQPVLVEEPVAAPTVITE
ncbi:MAG: zinc ribbon domain-containing protein [Clostridia bacterium]|nr:zinc ribbon domain-containing protein [Clostridia bacterium]